jgi:hypothetical protein
VEAVPKIFRWMDLVLRWRRKDKNKNTHNM